MEIVINDDELDIGTPTSNGPGKPNNNASSPTYECSVCLQSCVHPVELPCKHVFCFLCVKGAANRSKRCALCRQEIPQDYLNRPKLLEDINPDDIQFDNGYQWFYEGRNGWWQYDERTSVELEEFFKRNEKNAEILVAGFLYVMDFENMIQYRRNDPTRRRRVKRDLITSTSRKGVAGLKMDRPSVLGGRNGSRGDSIAVVTNHDTNISNATPTMELPNDMHNSLDLHVPNSTPQTSVNNSSLDLSLRSSHHDEVDGLSQLIDDVNLENNVPLHVPNHDD